MASELELSLIRLAVGMRKETGKKEGIEKEKMARGVGAKIK